MRMNRIPHCFMLILLMVWALPTTVRANVETISVKSGEFVSKKVLISPGFAVMFQFPGDVSALTLADQTSFSCEKMPTDPTRVLCKPLTTSAYTTNLVVSTSDNEFNLVLNIDPSGKEHAFKYIFANASGGSAGRIVTARQPSTPLQSAMSDLSALILEHYESETCSLKGSSSSLQFRCLNSIEIGSERYIRFSLVGKSDQSVRVVKIAMQEETLGGLTGLSVKTGSSQDIDYDIRNEILSVGSQTYGVLKLPRRNPSVQNRYSIFIMTDLGSVSDVRVYGL